MKPSKPYVIGLTGGIASGKSNLARALREAGAIVIDADALSRKLTQPGGAALPAIRQAFGNGAFLGEHLNRKALADLIFSDEDKRQQLNGIIHPLVYADIEQQIAQCTADIVVLEIPLLHETGYDARCDEVWCAYVPQRIQMERLRRRDGLTIREARARLQSQLPGIEKARRSTHVIRTDGTLEHSAQKVLALWADVQERVRHD